MFATRLSSRKSCAAVLTRMTRAGSTPRPSVAQLLVHRPASGPAVTALPTRFFSWSSHDDFAPQRKAAVSDDMQEAMDMIAQHVQENAIMLYMKGTPGQPMCGFSAQVVGCLKDTGKDFSSVNILDYPSIREGIKLYSEWPTIPQLYVNGEFIGGCDIITAMHESGELAELVAEVKD